MKRDFASLNAQEALHVAIFIEERNAEIYHQFAEMFAEFRDPESLEIAAAFWDMSNEERKHGTLLQKRYFDRYGTRPCAVTEEDISDFIEVPRLENGEIFTISRLKVGRSPRQMALEIAMAAEQNALRYYTRLSETTEDSDLRQLYREFVDFESGHSDWLEKKVAEARRTSGGTKLA
ncbi:MAG TPA: ferritin family protein [Terriglobales bacterium]|jgi:rubrerythrin|nr:ferritin family protein [Terriglobales bacterium]